MAHLEKYSQMVIPRFSDLRKQKSSNKSDVLDIQKSYGLAMQEIDEKQDTDTI